VIGAGAFGGWTAFNLLNRLKAKKKKGAQFNP